MIVICGSNYSNPEINGVQIKDGKRREDKTC
jgi:hypothetical protein